MHKDIILVDETQIKKPSGEVAVVYFSTLSNNTHRFVQRLNIKNFRIPYDMKKEIKIYQDYVLITPTYSGGDDATGAVPKQVIQFLNNKNNRDFCRGVVASGNTNFGSQFAIAGPILSKKLNVPLLYQFELIGTEFDTTTLNNILKDFWGQNNEYNI